jgi:hypothetical protein
MGVKVMEATKGMWRSASLCQLPFFPLSPSRQEAPVDVYVALEGERRGFGGIRPGDAIPSVRFRENR